MYANPRALNSCGNSVPPPFAEAFV